MFTSPRFHHALLLVAVLVNVACNPGFSGLTATREADGSPGQLIPDVELRFVSETGAGTHTTRADAGGSYTISLPQTRYYAQASHRDYEDYSSAPGLFLPARSPRAVANFFLRDPTVTTVLVVRHAEKRDPNSNVPEEPLSAAGEARAERLAETLGRAGITAVYSTDAVRTRATVGRLAGLFALPVASYADPKALAARIFAEHRGDVVLVGAHSNTITAVAHALGARVPDAVIDDFDNLFVIAAAGSGAHVTNLQYGADSTPDAAMNWSGATTFLLVGDAPMGSPLGQELIHALRKGNIAAIFANNGNGLVPPLAAALNITPQTYASADIPALVPQVLSEHPRSPVVMAGSHSDIRAIILALGGYPAPVLYAGDTDHLIVVTRFAAGAVRVVPLRF